ncbi:MAG TPA: cyanophycin synthetase, partial [Candidatus Paceibacterota bacterium]|nr:cyanophycin synthetase [Candidatus Paceibacterota bacterium]
SSPTTDMLSKKGIQVCLEQKTEQVPPDADLLVYSDAVPAENPERARGKELGIPEHSYFEALGKAVEGKRVVAVSGTHGKTTTTAMLGKILIDAGFDPTVIVGSIVTDFGSNFHAGKSDIVVVEACEYRRHFLTFCPEVLVITNIEWDHTDYFKSPEELAVAFNEARGQARIVIEKEQYGNESVPELLVPGEFNKENARAAKAAARAIAPDISEADMDKSLKLFKGSWRRFEYKGVLPGGALLYDDYAHHPTAIRKTIEAAKEKFPNKKIVVLFHPHLYSRTRDLFQDFAEALAVADEAYVLPVYAAREEYDGTVSNTALAEATNKRGGQATALGGLEEAAQKLKTFSSDTVVFTMGAGDIYKAGEAALRKAQDKP